MKLTNLQIYTYYNQLNVIIQNITNSLPIKVNFYLQKNKNILQELAIEIEKAKMEVGNKYGVVNEEEGRYIIPQENMEIAQKELEDLFSLEQEVNIYKVDIDAFGDDLKLTIAEMEALMFMIN